MQEESGHNWQMTFPRSKHQPCIPITLLLHLQVLGWRRVLNLSESVASTCKQVRICWTLASSPLLQAPKKASPAPSLPTILELCKTETLDFNRNWSRKTDDNRCSNTSYQHPIHLKFMLSALDTVIPRMSKLENQVNKFWVSSLPRCRSIIQPQREGDIFIWNSFFHHIQDNVQLCETQI